MSDLGANQKVRKPDNTVPHKPNALLERFGVGLVVKLVM